MPEESYGSAFFIPIVNILLIFHPNGCQRCLIPPYTSRRCLHFQFGDSLNCRIRMALHGCVCCRNEDCNIARCPRCILEDDSGRMIAMGVLCIVAFFFFRPLRTNRTHCGAFIGGSEKVIRHEAVGKRWGLNRRCRALCILTERRSLAPNSPG